MTDNNAAENSQTTPDNVVHTKETRIACNGGGGALGHPQIWLNMTTEGEVMCPYCSRLFVAEAKAS